MKRKEEKCSDTFQLERISSIFFFWSIFRSFLLKRVFSDVKRRRVRRQVDHRPPEFIARARGSIRRMFLLRGRWLRPTVAFAWLWVVLLRNPITSGRQHPKVFDANQPVAHTTKHLRQAGELVRDDSVHGTLKVREQRKPDASTVWVMGHQRLVVCQRVIVKEQTGCDVERNEDINGVMFVSGQDEEYSKHIE